MAACYQCKTELNEGASKCPHCLGWQTRRFPDPQSPKGLLVILGAIFAMITLPILVKVLAYSDEAKPNPAVADFEIMLTAVKPISAF